MINLRKTLTEVHQILNVANVKHALIGGLALAAYGEFRATSDVDLLADGSKKEIIKTALINQGYQLVFESNEVLQFSGNGFVDILLANRPLSLEMLQQALNNVNLDIFVLRAEDIIGLKIQAYKNDPSREFQDKADIQKLLSLKGIDMNLIKKYADLFFEWPEIQKIKDKIK